MSRHYAPLSAGSLASNTSFHKPDPLESRRVGLDDPAIEVMTDFRRVRVLTVPPGVTMEYAYQRMIHNGVRLLLVADDHNRVLGLITSTDVEDGKPLRVIHERGIRRDEILVSDVMTPSDRLEVIDFDDVLKARVGHVAATLKAVGRAHAMVVDRDEAGDQRVRGLFSATQVSRQLGTPIQPTEVARSFSEVGRVLMH
jgi:CBS domain-containing protein